MSATIVYREPYLAEAARSEGEALWLSPADLQAATGWEFKPEGLCRDEQCVPLPAGRKAEFLDAHGRLNLTAFARYLEQPVVHDEAHGVWVFGEAAAARRASLHAGVAPDFRLPDIDGKMHSLSDYRGKKVLFLTWASW